MRKKLILTAIILAVVVLLFEKHIGNALLGLVLTGGIPGTSLSLPFWLMMAIYCTIISLVVAWYTESLIVAHRMRQASHKQRMPKRRYSHI